ncbi:MAG: hypothetical protein V1897_06715, partial [Pseudomonadota bacterium]
DLRNKLLLWRFNNFSKMRNQEDYVNKSIDWRLNQIYSPLLTLVGNKEDEKKILSFAKVQYVQNRVDAGQQIEVRVLSVIKEIDEKAEGHISISDIKNIFIKHFENEYDRKVTHRFIGSIVRKKLRLKTRKRNGLYILSENQKEKFQHLYEKYGI